jgi:hypothetical protein
MPGAVIGGVAAVGGSLLSARAAKKASRAEQQANQLAMDEQRRQFDVTRQDMAPFMQAGQQALNRLQDPAAFQSDPGYGYALDQSEQALMRQRAATGGLASGNTLAALQQNAVGLANQDYGNWWNRQAGLAGAGQASAGQLGQFGQNAAGNIGNLLQASGQARASGIAGSANALGAGLGAATEQLGSGFMNWRANRLDSRAGLQPVQVTARRIGGI